MSGRSGRPAAGGIAFGAVALALLGAAGAGAQGLSGVALGPDGQPLAGHTVILHRVGAGGGATAGTDTTDASGAFTFTLDGDARSAYFAALRYEGELYIGPAADGSQSITDYVLEVTPSAAIGNVGGVGRGGALPPAQAQAPRQMPPTGAPTGGSSDAGALWLVGLLALATAAAFVLTAPRYRRRRTRDALIEVASIENRLAEDELTDDERDRLQARRDRVKEQLAPGG
jgi:hypothetical protein